MATKQVRVCDRDDNPGAVTVMVLIDGVPRREDLCPDCREPIEQAWEQMPRPTPRKSTRRLEVVSMDDVLKAAKATRASRRPQTGS